MLKSLMTYVNGLLLALLILALSSRSSGNLISDDPINFVPDGHYVIAKIVFLSYHRFKSMPILETWFSASTILGQIFQQSVVIWTLQMLKEALRRQKCL